MNEMDETLWTIVRLPGRACSLGGHLSREEALRRLRANAEEEIRATHVFLQELDTDEAQITWWRGFRPLPTPTETSGETP